MRTAYAYASLISSTDPVATLATFGAMNVDPLLYILVFGESQINDAVAITLFESINGNEADKTLTLGKIVVKIFVLLFGSLGLGIALAVALVLIMRFTRLGRSSHNAILFLAGSPFVCYTLAEQVGMSGIITVLFASIMIGGYAPTHLSAEATTLASFFFETNGFRWRYRGLCMLWRASSPISQEGISPLALDHAGVPSWACCGCLSDESLIQWH